MSPSHDVCNSIYITFVELLVVVFRYFIYGVYDNRLSNITLRIFTKFFFVLLEVFLLFCFVSIMKLDFLEENLKLVSSDHIFKLAVIICSWLKTVLLLVLLHQKLNSSTYKLYLTEDKQFPVMPFYCYEEECYWEFWILRDLIF